MAPITIGLVGYGKIAADQHVPSIRANPAFRLEAAVSGSRGAIDGIPRVFPTLTEMLAARPAIEAVALCTPPGPRADLARQVIAAGRHVLLEKPPAATLTEAEELAQLAGTSPGVVFATWHSRFNPSVEEARRRLAGTQVTTLRVTWKEDVRRWHPGQDWVFGEGGFGVFDPGINAFSIVTRILPEPIHVTAAILQTPANRQSPIAARITFGLPGKSAKLAAELDWRETGTQVWEVEVGTEAGPPLLLSDGGRRLSIGSDTVVDGGPGEYPGIYAHFAELIGSGRSDVDLAPLRLAADAFLIGRREETDPFNW